MGALPTRLQTLLVAVASMAGAAEAAAQASGRIAAGTPAETPYYISDSGVPGPTVVITAGVHGDEPAGRCAADQIRQWPVKAGRLVVVPCANVFACREGTRLTPGAAAGEGNLNRNFPLSGREESARGELAGALWSFVRQQKPAWLLDLHEGIDFSAQTNRSVGSSLIVCPTPEGKRMAAALLEAVNGSITNRAQRFTLRSPPVDGSLVRAAGAHAGAQAMMAETTSKGQPLSLRVRQHRILAHALLSRLGMVDASVTPEVILPDEAARLFACRVAVYDAEGSGGAGAKRVAEQVGKTAGACACWVCGDDIRGGALGAFNVFVVPGGMASGEAAALGERGRDRIRAFVREGGGYVGICAGAYLALDGFSWGLGLIGARTSSPSWRRGKGEVQLELTDAGRSLFGERRGTFDCHYANGPCLAPAGTAGQTNYETLAWFRSELAEHGAPAGLMINTPAIIAGRYGRGRVMCISPHPEQTPGLEAFTPAATAWAAGLRDATSN